MNINELGEDLEQQFGKPRNITEGDRTSLTVFTLWFFALFHACDTWYLKINLFNDIELCKCTTILDKVFKGIATDGKGTMGCCHGFKLHLACNAIGEIIAFVLTGANVSDKELKVFKVLTKDCTASCSQTRATYLRGCLTFSLRMEYSWWQDCA